MQDEHRPCAFADDEVALPMAGLAAAFNGLRAIMDRRSILDGVARVSAAILVREIGCNKINRLDLAMIFENIRLI